MVDDLETRIRACVNGGQLMRLRKQVLRALADRTECTSCLEDIIDQGRTGEDAQVMAELAMETLRGMDT